MPGNLLPRLRPITSIPIPSPAGHTAHRVHDLGNKLFAFAHHVLTLLTSIGCTDRYHYTGLSAVDQVIAGKIN